MKAQATQLLALARQLIAEGEADPAGEAFMLKIDDAVEALEALATKVKDADAAMDELCSLVDDHADRATSDAFYKGAGRVTKAIQDFNAAVTGFKAGHDGMARALGKAQMVK